jgi:hypothetical protein
MSGDFFVYIPQYGNETASLIVTVAASIVLHHFGWGWDLLFLSKYNSLVESGICVAANSHKAVAFELLFYGADGCAVLNFHVPTLNSHMFSLPAMVGHYFGDIYVFI